MKNVINSGVSRLSVFLILTFLLIYITDHYILTVNFYENSGDPLAGNPAKDGDVYETLQKWIYLSSAVYLLLKLTITTLILYTALYLGDQTVPFRKLFKVSVNAEFIFLVPAVVKIGWFYFFHPASTLSAWHHFYFLSALSLIQTVPADYSYLLQTLNAFEIVYWFLLAFGIYKYSSLSFDSSLRVVIFSYLPLLFIWIAIITFSSLMLFPDTATL